MGLFAQASPPPPPQDILSSARSSLKDFQKRTLHMQTRSREIKTGTDMRDVYMESMERDFQSGLRILSIRIQHLKESEEKLSLKITDSINMMRQLARENELQEIKDNIDRFDIPNLVTRAEFETMCEEAINDKIR